MHLLYTVIYIDNEREINLFQSKIDIFRILLMINRPSLNALIVAGWTLFWLDARARIRPLERAFIRLSFCQPRLFIDTELSSSVGETIWRWKNPRKCHAGMTAYRAWHDATCDALTLAKNGICSLASWQQHRRSMIDDFSRLIRTVRQRKAIMFATQVENFLS